MLPGRFRSVPSSRKMAIHVDLVVARGVVADEAHGGGQGGDELVVEEPRGLGRVDRAIDDRDVVPSARAGLGQKFGTVRGARGHDRGLLRQAGPSIVGAVVSTWLLMLPKRSTFGLATSVMASYDSRSMASAEQTRSGGPRHRLKSPQPWVMRGLGGPPVDPLRGGWPALVPGLSGEISPHLPAMAEVHIQCIDDLKEAASRKMGTMVKEFFNEGADDCHTVLENEQAWSLYRIRPRVMRNVETIDTTTQLLGSTVPVPFSIGPASMQRLCHPEGEVATSKGAAALGLPMGVSTFATRTLEDIIAHRDPSVPYVMQLRGSRRWR
ncbi:hypothetical protein VTK73DRAFT_5088 [Phialemonium thermophilum]|uniref:FMN hydroxy acid dehydrogenase domain-containing protein n=1 Tax=Phialemonium thermophilum TaxID=223376 RepID=A0ABR3V4Y3_9PEZI